MQCPFRFRELVEDYVKEKILGADCLKAECAWWSKTYAMCDINILTQELYELTEAVKDINNKMTTR